MSSANVAIVPLSADDTDGIVWLYERAAMTESSLGPVPASSWRRFVSLPQNANGRDFRVASHNQRIVALAESHLKRQGEAPVRFCKIVVDPDFRRCGIATTLLAHLLEIEPRDDALTFQCLVSPDWASGIAFTDALGFAPTESELRMRCSQLAPPPICSLRSIVFERAPKGTDHFIDISRIHNVAYRDDAAFRYYTPEEMMLALDGDDLWIAREGTRLLAFLQLSLEPDCVWIESLAVGPNDQGRGLGSTLLAYALQEVQIGEGRQAVLNVSSKNPRAIDVYERLGFSQFREMQRMSVLRRILADTIASHLKERYEVWQLYEAPTLRMT